MKEIDERKRENETDENSEVEGKQLHGISQLLYSDDYLLFFYDVHFFC